MSTWILKVSGYIDRPDKGKCPVIELWMLYKEKKKDSNCQILDTILFYSFFEANLNGAGDDISLQAGNIRLNLPPEKIEKIKAYNEKRVIVGIRPEDFRLAAEHIPGNSIETIVEVVEPIGNKTYVNVKTDDFTLVVVVGRKTQVKAHSTLILEPVFENLHLFDIRDEKALS